MPRDLACPDVARLQRFLVGWIAEPESLQLEQHIAICEQCLDRLSHLPANDPLELALRDHGADDTHLFVDLAEAAIPLLKQLRSREETRSCSPGREETPVSRVPPVGEQTPFDAPGADGELGRLGPYRVLRQLGAGGMGVVYLAEDPRLKRQLALKVIHPSVVAREDVRERFLREAQAVAAVEHEHIVGVFEVNESRGLPYLAMPLLRGESLQDLLDRSSGPLPVDDTLRFGREVAEGLAAAHDRGLIHRDIKPGNIFLSVDSSPSSVAEEGLLQATDNGPRTKVKILDFGLARALDPEDADEGRPLTYDGAIAGTPRYMSPEQARSESLDARADLFSLGCVLYRMATGQGPFQADHAIGAILKVLTEIPTAPRKLNPELPPALAGLIEQLLAKPREQRPASARAVAGALRAIEKQREEARRPKPSRRRWLLVSAGCALAATGLTAGLVRLFKPLFVPHEPGEVTIEFDEPDRRLALRRGDEAERLIDLKQRKTHLLPPGDYALRTIETAGKRRLIPDRLLVKPGVKHAVGLRLVGERNRHQVHAHYAVGGVAAVGTKGDTLVLAVGGDRTLSVWDPAREGKPEERSHPDSPLRCLAVSSETSQVATGSGDIGPRAVQVIRLWSLEKVSLHPPEMKCRSQVNALAFSPNGNHLLSGENDGTLTLWATQNGVMKWQLRPAHDGLGTFALAWLPDGKHFLTAGGDGLVLLRESTTGAAVRKLAGHSKAVRAVAILSRGQEAVSGGLDATIHVWDLVSASARVVAAPAPILALAVSPDGKRLLTGDTDNAVRLWDLKAGCELIRFDGHVKGVTAVAFLPDNRRAASGGNDGLVCLWELPM